MEKIIRRKGGADFLVLAAAAGRAKELPDGVPKATINPVSEFAFMSARTLCGTKRLDGRR